MVGLKELYTQTNPLLFKFRKEEGERRKMKIDGWEEREIEETLSLLPSFPSSFLLFFLLKEQKEKGEEGWEKRRQEINP